MLVLLGDFRQFPPITVGEDSAGRKALLDACLPSAVFWPEVTMLRLRTNMRMQAEQQPPGVWTPRDLESIGDGTMPMHPYVRVPDAMCLPPGERSLEALISHVWGPLQQGDRWKDPQWLSERTILAGLPCSTG